MTNDYAVQIVEHYGENDFKVKKEAIKQIYGDEKVANLPLVVLCIAGAARKGKSFMLNFFLDYLTHKEKYPNKSWSLNETTKLNGFEFKDGEDRMTLGIWAWNHVFVIENDAGKKVAVSLIDSQGTFDKSTSYEDCSAIFAMTSMFSSVMCFNVFTDLQEDKLNDFTAFIDHGKKIVQNLGGSGKLFQSLVFIIRDFNFKKYLDKENGGQEYVENQLGDVKNKNLQKVRDNLKESYERMYGFVFPYPGAKVAQEKTSKISEIDQTFVKKAKTMVEALLSQRNLQPKELGSAKILCKDMIEYIPLCVKCFNDHPTFAPQAVQTVNREFMINLEVKRAIKEYERIMDETFLKCKAGFETVELRQRHDSGFIMIKKEITERMKDKNICYEVIEKIMEDLKSVSKKYQEKNALLVENEKKRVNLIKEKRQHEEQIARKNAETEAKLEAQKREHQLQQERNRQEEAKRAAEAAARFEKEKREQEARLREEMEKQRKENEKKLEDDRRRQAEERRQADERNQAEMARMQRDLARLELERRERSYTPATPVIIYQQPSGYGGGFSGWPQQQPSYSNSGGRYSGGNSNAVPFVNRHGNIQYRDSSTGRFCKGP